MVSTPSSDSDTGDPVELVREHLNGMQEYAEAGDWQKVQAIVGRMQSLIEQVPLSKRRDLVLEASRGVDKIRQSANYARNEVCEKLSSIRQGRKAAASYKAAGALR